MFPLMTNDLARRLEQIEASAMTSWATALELPPSNPFQLRINRVGKATAIVSRDLVLGSMFCRVLGYSDETSPSLAGLIDTFAREHSPLRIDLNPYNSTPGLLKELAAAKLRPVRHQSIVYAPCAAPRLPDDDAPTTRVRVHPVASKEAAAFAKIWRETYAQTLGASPTAQIDLSAATSSLHKTPGWNLYVATVSGEPAAVAALFIHDNVGFLAMAGTLQQYRGQGCQTALIQQRLADAFQNNCQLVTSVVDLGSTAQHNMERAGLRVGYTRAYWVRFP